MRARVSARSISRPIRQLLRREASTTLHVLAAFRRACTLVSAKKEGTRRIIALVTSEVGDGPLNIVVGEGGWDPLTVEPGMVAHVDGAHLQIGRWVIALRDADVWEPRPDWTALRGRRAAIEARLPALRALVLLQPSDTSFLSLLEEDLLEEVHRDHPRREAVLGAAQSGVDVLGVGWGGHSTQLLEGAAQLAGLGSGLTPSGDDFLCGTMLSAWLVSPNPLTFCRAIARVAAPRTTALSAALLWAASRGECSAAWHRLLDALGHGDASGIIRRAEDVLAHGATSGGDAMAGFLWAGLQSHPTHSNTRSKNLKSAR